MKDCKTETPATAGIKAILKKCQERGLVMMVCGQPHNVFRYISTLVITEEDLTKGFDILEYAKREVNSTI